MEYASRGVANAGLTTGIIGSALGLLNNGGMGILGCGASCSENSMVNRYELAQEQKIAELQTQVALRDANTYVDQKLLTLYQYVEGKFNTVEQQICQQATVNAQIADNIGCMQQSIATLNSLTKTVVPIDNVCPQPMAQYNSWTAPTTPSTT